MDTNTNAINDVLGYILDSAQAINDQVNVKQEVLGDRKSTRLNSSHIPLSRMPSSA